MQFHQPLDRILDSSVKVRVLRFLCRKGGEWSGRRAAAELNLNPVTAHAALRALHQATVLDFRKAGNNFMYSLRDEHYLVQRLLRPLFQRESGALELLSRLLREKLGQGPQLGIVTVALYGSVARGQEEPTSDLDLLLVVRSEQARQRVRAKLDRLWEAVAKEFGNHLAAYVNTESELRQKYRRRLPLLRNILATHQLIWGRPLQEILSGRST